MLEDILRASTAPGALPGVSLATLRSGELAAVHVMGVRGSHDGAAVDTHTVFEAASLTKPLVSFMALQLAEEGRLDLDAPLQALCGDYVPDDERARAITALHVLTHTSGLPNIVTSDTPLKTYFPPGERFSYGSSAFAWLQRAMETLTGESLEQLAQERVFSRFGMADSSLHWQSRFEPNHAQGHDMDAQPVPKRRPAQAMASWSLLTTAADYARFVQAAALRGEGLSASMHARWFAPAVQARQGVDDILNPGAAEQDDVAWGLGWGLEPSQDCVFHWGNSPGFRALVVASRSTQDAVVWFANSARGLRLAHRVLPVTVPGEHRCLEWLRIEGDC